jgi:hypothetical protein
MSLWHYLFCTHRMVLTTHEGSRLFLRCVQCGRESAGWTLDAAPPVRRF